MRGSDGERAAASQAAKYEKEHSNTRVRADGGKAVPRPPSKLCANSSVKMPIEVAST